VDNDQLETSRDDHPTGTGVAAGLAVGGVVALVVAWVLGNDFSPAEPGSGWVRVATVVVVLLLGGAVWLRWRRPGDRTIPRTTFALAGAAFVLVVLAGWGFVGQYLRGFPGQAALLATLGGLAVTSGALLGVRTTEKWRALPAAGTFLLVAVVATPLMLVVPDVRVDATTASAAEAPAVPTSVSTVAWSTEVDQSVRDVVPAGTGVVLLLDNGVMALDGRTGDIRWSRVRHGAEAAQVDVSPDGRTVLVQYRPGDRFQVQREIIDAYTGEVRYTVDSGESDSETGFVSPLTNTVYIGGDNESEYYGYSLIDGRKLWTYRLPRGCWAEIPTKHFTVPSGLLLPVVCPEEDVDFQYVMVNGTTGKVRWTYDMPFESDTSGGIFLDAKISPDHRILAVSASPDTSDERIEAVVDTETGKALPAPRPERLGAGGIGLVALSEEESQLVDLRSGKPMPSTAASLDCLWRTFGAVLASGAACVDPAIDLDDTGFVENGRTELGMTTFAGEELHLVPVAFGGPLDRSSYDDPIRFVAAPGAVVVTAGMPLAEGGRLQVIGLR
jgi:hypothetical protein